MPAGKTQRTQRGDRLSRQVLLRQNQPIEDKRSDLRYHIFSLVTSKAELLRRTSTFIAAPVPADSTKLETFGRRQTRGTKLGWESMPILGLSLRSSKAKYLMGNHLRIERKENLRIERKEKTQGSTDQSEKRRNGDQKRKGGKDRPKSNKSTKDACKYCKKEVHLGPAKKMVLLMQKKGQTRANGSSNQSQVK